MELGLLFMSILVALIGVGISAVASLIPGLHIYNVIAITMTLVFAVHHFFSDLDPLLLTSFLVGLVAGFSLLFTISSQFFQPCDDSYRYII